MLGFAERIGGAVDEAYGELERLAKLGLAGGHFAGVDFVVHAGEVQETVEEEDAELFGESVAVLGGLAAGGLERDGEITGVAVVEALGRGEAENVGGLVLAAELAVQAAESSVVRQEDFDLAVEADCGPCLVGETGERNARKSPG